LDRLLQSTGALRSRKQAKFVEMEEALFAALCELWPQPKRRITLRLVAMISIGALRLAIESCGRALISSLTFAAGFVGKFFQTDFSTRADHLRSDFFACT
jgi:hypothetical protein